MKIRGIKFPPLTFVYIPPLVMHKTEGDGYTKVNIYYSTDYFSETENEFFTKMLSKKVITPTAANKNKVLEILEKLEKLSTVDTPESTVFIKSLTLELLCLMCEKDNVTLTTVSPSEDLDRPPILNNILKYIENNLQNDLSLKKIADEFFISYVYLCKLFQTYMPFSVNRTIENYRINKARDLLQKTNKSIEQISEECGFSSANYFSLAFKRNTGLSPLNYRKYEKEK